MDWSHRSQATRGSPDAVGTGTLPGLQPPEALQFHRALPRGGRARPDDAHDERRVEGSKDGKFHRGWSGHERGKEAEERHPDKYQRKQGVNSAPGQCGPHGHRGRLPSWPVWVGLIVDLDVAPDPFRTDVQRVDRFEPSDEYHQWQQRCNRWPAKEQQRECQRGPPQADQRDLEMASRKGTFVAT